MLPVVGGGALGTVLKNMKKTRGIGNQRKNIQTPSLLRLARILRVVLTLM